MCHFQKLLLMDYRTEFMDYGGKIQRGKKRRGGVEFMLELCEIQMETLTFKMKNYLNDPLGGICRIFEYG